MSKVYETLKKKNDTSVEVYPNIERQNIPNGAVNSDKVEDKAVTYNKLNDALRQQSDDFSTIYNHEDDELNVTELNVVDDIGCRNLNVENDINVEYNINVKGGVYDEDDDEIVVIKRHSIRVKLCNTLDHTDIRDVVMNFISSRKDAITSYIDLFNELKNKVYLSVYDIGSDISGVISSVDFQGNGDISIYVGDGNGGLEEIDFDAIDTITDNVFDI